MKPENIMLMKEEQLIVKIADLGISKVLNGQGRRSDGGTLFYMPPEAFSKQKIDYTCDIWALGCILHEMITGSKLYMEGDDPRSIENSENHVKQRILNTVPPRLPDIFSRPIRYAVYLML